MFLMPNAQLIMSNDSGSKSVAVQSVTVQLNSVSGKVRLVCLCLASSIISGLKSAPVILAIPAFANANDRSPVPQHMSSRWSSFAGFVIFTAVRRQR